MQLGGYRVKSDPFLIACLAAMAVMAALIMWYVPPDMDDYNQYHALACMVHPNSVWNHFRESCNGSYDLRVFGRWHWPRSYGYVGATYSFLYYPLFLIWPDWKSVVLFGMLIMIPGVFAASRILKVQPLIASIVLCGTFPIMSYTLRDYGQITIQFTLLYLLPYLAWKAVTARKYHSWLTFSLLAGFLLAMGIESKAVFIYFVPSVVLVTIAVCWPQRPSYSIVWLLIRKLWPGVLLASALLFALFTAYDNHHTVYYRALIGMVPKEHSVDSVFGHTQYLLAMYWLNFPNAIGVIYGMKSMTMLHGPFDWHGFLITLPFWVIMVATAWLYARHRYNNPHYSRMISGLVMASLMGVIFIGIDRHSHNPHHILQPFYLLLGPPAIMLQSLYRQSRNVCIALLGLLMMSQLACTVYVICQKAEDNHTWQRLTVLDFIRENHLAESGVIDHLDWGIYYISSLYGPKNQVVLFQASVGDAMRIAHHLGRDAVFIRRRGGKFKAPRDVRRVYPAPGTKNNLWEVWTNAPLG